MRSFTRLVALILRYLLVEVSVAVAAMMFPDGQLAHKTIDFLPTRRSSVLESVADISC